MTKIALVGIGRWGRNHLRNYYNMDSCELSLVCDADESNITTALKDYPDLKTTQSFDDVLNDAEIEGVVLATPAATHFEMGKKVLASGKHVFIEKPIVLKTEHLNELIALAKQKDKIIMEGHLLLYHGAVNAMKKAIAEGMIGDLQHIYCRRTNLGAIRFEANVLWDTGPHDISIAFYLLDENPASISADAVSVYPQGTAETVFTAIKFNDDKMIHMHESWLDPFKDRKCIAVGSKGMLIMDELAEDGKVKFVKKSVTYKPEEEFEHNRFDYHDEGVEVVAFDEVEPLRTECEHFVSAIKNGTEVRSNGENSLRVLRTLEAAQASLDKMGEPVSF